MYDSERQKEEKKIKNRRSGRTRTIWGWALLIVGGLNLLDSARLFSVSFMTGVRGCFLPLALTLLGAWLIWKTRKDVAKWDRYDMLINQNGNTHLPMIADKAGIPLDQVRKDIQQMINNGFFRDENGSVGAYIHGEYDILVMMRNGQPKEPVEKTVKEQEEKERKARESAEKAKSIDPMAESIRLAAAEAEDPDVAESLQSIADSVAKINRKIKRNPDVENAASVRQLREIYLPKTLELVDKLRNKDAGPDTMLEIKGILNTCAVAYKGIVDKVYKQEDLDTLVDIDVLKETFEREGLLGSDFDVK